MKEYWITADRSAENFYQEAQKFWGKEAEIKWHKKEHQSITQKRDKQWDF